MATVEETASLWVVWASVSGWMSTSAFLFLLFNLVVGTIALTSSIFRRPDDHHHPHLPRALSRGPSVLERIRSFNFTHYRHSYEEALVETAAPPDHQHPHLPRALSRGASILERIRSFNFNQYRHSYEEPLVETAAPPVRVEEEKEERSAAAPNTLEDAYRNFKRSQSDSTPAAEKQKVVELRKVETEKPAKAREEEEEEVDAEADDFINRFRKQLQLQRLESLLRNRREPSRP